MEDGDPTCLDYLTAFPWQRAEGLCGGLIKQASEGNDEDV